MTYDKFLHSVDQYCSKHLRMRYGQAVMNVLYSFDQTLHDQVISDGLDIFYVTNRADIDRTLAYLQARWAPSLGGTPQAVPVQLSLPFDDGPERYS